MKKYSLRKERKYRIRRFVIMFTLVMMISSLVSTVVMANNAHDADSYEYIAVEPGDTLWDLAERYYPNQNVRSAISEIKAINKLESSNLSIGQVLLMPEI